MPVRFKYLLKRIVSPTSNLENSLPIQPSMLTSRCNNTNYFTYRKQQQ